MKTVSGKVVSTKPVNLSKAANILSNFVTSDNGASQSVSAYLRRASTAFNELVYFKKHHKLKKHRAKEEASSNSDINPRNSEDEARVVENGGANRKFDQDPVEIVKKEKGKVEGKLRKKEKTKGSEENDSIRVEFEEDNEIMKENNEDKKKKKRKNAGEIGNPEALKRKKRRRSETDE